MVQEKKANTANWVIRFFDKTLSIAEMEVRKLRHDPTELITRAVQPALWLLIFGEVFTRIHIIPTGNLSYLSFITPGILAQSVLFIAIFYGIAVIWERDLGILHKFLVSPTPRQALVLGKGLVCRDPGTFSSCNNLYTGGVDWRRHQLESHKPNIGGSCRNIGFVLVLNIFTNYSFAGEDTRTLHGHRSNIDNALVLCKQRHLPIINDASLATNSCAS